VNVVGAAVEISLNPDLLGVVVEADVDGSGDTGCKGEDSAVETAGEDATGVFPGLLAGLLPGVVAGLVEGGDCVIFNRWAGCYSLPS